MRAEVAGATGLRVPAEWDRERLLRLRAAGRRYLEVTARRPHVDFARFVKGLLDGPHPDAEKVVLVMDQLNTHSPVPPYEALEPTEAKRRADRLEIHHTPKHGSWLNVAKIELSTLGKPLPGRAGDAATLAGPMPRPLNAIAIRPVAAATGGSPPPPA